MDDINSKSQGQVHIPITMCHGIRPESDFPLTIEHFDRLIRVAAEMEFTSIHYGDLAAWRDGRSSLPERPIMFDFDHAEKSIYTDVHRVLSNYGFAGNLFIYTQELDPESRHYGTSTMTFEEIGELTTHGWHIGSHTISHPCFYPLLVKDPSGQSIEWELAESRAVIRKQLGVEPIAFAYTGTSWCKIAEDLVKKYYRFARIWISGSHYGVEGKKVRYADFLEVPGSDEEDGGPPLAARYVTGDSHPYRLPSLEIQRPFIYDPERFRLYLEEALRLSA